MCRACHVSGDCHPPAERVAHPTFPSAAVRNDFADEVDQTRERVYVTRNGRDFVVLLSKADLDSLEATLELLTDQAAQQRLADAERALVTGDLTSAAEMASLMEERRRASGV
ncbi:MAG: antitoxin YefM [Actinomycetota bacterium]|nr:antitoxin YefM [Actinomycetota bacterium]